MSAKWKKSILLFAFACGAAGASEYRFSEAELELDVDDATAFDPSLEERAESLQADAWLSYFPQLLEKVWDDTQAQGRFISTRSDAPLPLLQFQVYLNASDVGKQFLIAYYNNQIRNIFPVSGGRSGTPLGHYHPVLQFKDEWSSTHGRPNSHNMDRAIYFIQTAKSGWAIHTTVPSHYAELGGPASMGCVRLFRKHADENYWFAKQLGRSGVSIDIFGKRNPPPEITDLVRTEVQKGLDEIAAFNVQRAEALKAKKAAAAAAAAAPKPAPKVKTPPARRGVRA